MVYALMNEQLIVINEEFYNCLLFRGRIIFPTTIILERFFQKWPISLQDTPLRLLTNKGFENRVEQFFGFKY